MSNVNVSDLGEKRIIRELVKPLFNPHDDPNSVGDDCAILSAGDQFLIVSTDRVPSDLIAFKHGVLDYSGLGAYAANLNLSDIAACGGKPEALLLVVAMPPTLPLSDFSACCHGFRAAALCAGASVMGGDISSSESFSVSATAIGRIENGSPLRRAGAKPGDRVFLTRPLGLTPCALQVLCNPGLAGYLTDVEKTMLFEQFSLPAMIEVGLMFQRSGNVSSCMDNTDGVGNCLMELAEASRCKIVVNGEKIVLLPIVKKVAGKLGIDPVELAFGAGADFSLVVTVEREESVAGDFMQEIGTVEAGSGVEIQENGIYKPLLYTPWNYFQMTIQT